MSEFSGFGGELEPGDAWTALGLHRTCIRVNSIYNVPEDFGFGVKEGLGDSARSLWNSAVPAKALWQVARSAPWLSVGFWVCEGFGLSLWGWESGVALLHARGPVSPNLEWPSEPAEAQGFMLAKWRHGFMTA